MCRETLARAEPSAVAPTLRDGSAPPRRDGAPWPRSTYAARVKLYGTIRQTPSDQVSRHELERADVETEAQNYDLALAALRAQVPDGWQLIGISRWPLEG